MARPPRKGILRQLKFSKTATATKRTLNIFISYSHRDEKLRNEFESHLSWLRRSGQISMWNDRKITAGTVLALEIDKHLESSDIVILLISPDFFASDYCYAIEMAKALKRHELGLARVLPVILRPCEWHGTPIGQLMLLPRDAKPVITWAHRDEAFLDAAKGVRKAVDELLESTGKRAKPVSSPPMRKKA